MKKILSIIPMILVVAFCAAQQVGERLTKSSVVIYNNTKNKKIILLGNNTKLDTFKLMENEVWLSPPFEYDPIFKLQTQNHVVNYQLKPGNYYMIFWNGKKKYWDLKKSKK